MADALAHSAVSQTTASASGVAAAEASITAFINSHASVAASTLDLVGIVPDSGV